MPAPNSKLKHGERYLPLTRKVYRKFKKETESKLTFEEYQAIIMNTLTRMGKYVYEEPDGVQLPELGYLVVNKFKQKLSTKKVGIDWISTRKYGKLIPLSNAHTFGYIYWIDWFSIGIRVSNLQLYRFDACRHMKRNMSKTVRAGKQYFRWENTDFWHMSKLERRFNKQYKKKKE